ncbi:MAG: DUF896 domain-containing protein [Christensenellaceae bacterium]|nr:DUF896 domain-containing protein [Christensenellaceae bacterium]
MKQENIDRINELARKSKTPEGLTEEEKQEQAQLRKEYIAAFRASMEQQLQGVYRIDDKGRRVSPKKKS